MGRSVSEGLTLAVLQILWTGQRSSWDCTAPSPRLLRNKACCPRQKAGSIAWPWQHSSHFSQTPSRPEPVPLKKFGFLLMNAHKKLYPGYCIWNNLKKEARLGGRDKRLYLILKLSRQLEKATSLKAYSPVRGKPGSASVSQHCGSTQYKTPPFPAVLPSTQGGRSKQIFTKRKLTSQLVSSAPAQTKQIYWHTFVAIYLFKDWKNTHFPQGSSNRQTQQSRAVTWCIGRASLWFLYTINSTIRMWWGRWLCTTTH